MNSHYPWRCLSCVSQITSTNLFLSLLANFSQICLRQQQQLWANTFLQNRWCLGKESQWSALIEGNTRAWVCTLGGIRDATREGDLSQSFSYSSRSIVGDECTGKLISSTAHKENLHCCELWLANTGCFRCLYRSLRAVRLQKYSIHGLECYSN